MAKQPFRDLFELRVELSLPDSEQPGPLREVCDLISGTLQRSPPSTWTKVGNASVCGPVLGSETGATAQQADGKGLSGKCLA
jgi:hypothetical protein